MPLVLLAAGGTGGHLFAAEALAEALARRSVATALATDDRAERYGRAFPARDIHVITSATVRGRDPLSLMRTAAMLGTGTVQSLRLIMRMRPSAVVGFGGYPTIPPVLAATCHSPTSVASASRPFASTRPPALSLTSMARSTAPRCATGRSASAAGSRSRRVGILLVGSLAA